MTRWTRLFLVVALVVLAGCTAVTDDVTPTPTVENPGGPDTTTPPASQTNWSTGTDVPSLSFEPADRIDVQVTAVVDGDTIDVRMPDGSEETVRLVGIDTPETHAENDPAEFEDVPDTESGATCLRAAGHDASTYVEDRLADANVTLLFDPGTDRRGGYGRLLAYVSHDGTNVNYALVASGNARVYDTTFALREEFYAAEERAQTGQRGLWTCRDPS